MNVKQITTVKKKSKNDCTFFSAIDSGLIALSQQNFNAKELRFFFVVRRCLAIPRK